MERGELLLTDLLMNNDKLSEGAYSVSLSENICHWKSSGLDTSWESAAYLVEGEQWYEVFSRSYSYYSYSVDVVGFLKILMLGLSRDI